MGTLDNLKNVSFFKLLGESLKLKKKVVSLDKEYLTQEGSRLLKANLPYLIALLGCLVFLVVGGVLLVATIVLVLNIWLAPWLSALIVTLVFLVLGAVLGLVGGLKMKNGVEEGKTLFAHVGEDIKCLK